MDLVGDVRELAVGPGDAVAGLREEPLALLQPLGRAPADGLRQEGQEDGRDPPGDLVVVLARPGEEPVRSLLRGTEADRRQQQLVRPQRFGQGVVQDLPLDRRVPELAERPQVAAVLGGGRGALEVLPILLEEGVVAVQGGEVQGRRGEVGV